MDNFVESSYQLELDMQKQLFSMEQISAKFDEFGRLYEHIAAFGIDSTLVRMFNNDKQLDVIVGTPMPSCENFELHESPESGLSIAAMEGFGEFFGKIVEFIKNIFKKIWGWIESIFGFGERKVLKPVDGEMFKKQLQEELNKVFQEANAVNAKLTTPNTATHKKFSKYYLDFDKFFDEISKNASSVKNELSGTFSHSKLRSTMTLAIEDLNKETDYNPDNPKFKEKIELDPLSSECMDRILRGFCDDSKSAGAKYRKCSSEIHTCVKSIQQTVDKLLKSAEDKQKTSEDKQEARRILNECRSFTTLTAKFVSTIVHKTAAALRLYNRYSWECTLRLG